MHAKCIAKIFDSDGTFNLSEYKVIYIAPMKSLVREMVENFGRCLSVFGIKVAELSGDMQLSCTQMEETQIIVSTPEKWDIITRKTTDRSVSRMVSLMIIDRDSSSK